jgi:hypothetical protein
MRTHPARILALTAVFGAALAAGPCGPTDSGKGSNTVYRSAWSSQFTFSERSNGNGCDLATTDTGTVTITMFSDGTASLNRTGTSTWTGVTAVNGGHCSGVVLGSHAIGDGGAMVVNGSNVTFNYQEPPQTDATGYVSSYTLAFSGVLSNGVITGTMTEIQTGSGNGSTSGSTFQVSLTLH